MQHHVINNQYQKHNEQQSRKLYQKFKHEKRLYIGSPYKDFNEEDFIELFGFNTIAYLQKNCRVELPIGKSGKNKDFVLQ